ncbi:L-lactate dehydrogenase B [Cokeromyces recurvatus]|uniref:L-lactate dehydrogenase B n=1 Tax=Cokeromyces recurvatus TaxID=90255 RepID=UPI0022210F53|nr:L-lactate dehydrogenase B [Cokeromyces recurvatus]KAI7906694.1 L-lactate dehydrogenase B [Cokeromyces recurvatus]
MVSHSRVSIVGAGSVGASVAYALMFKNICSEILIVDISPDIVQAQVLDLADTASISHTRIREGTAQEAGQTDIIVITAGAKQREGETRIRLIERNYRVLKNVIHSMQPIRQDAVILMVSNPVDILTHIARKLSGLPPHQVIGSGTYLDTTRLCVHLGDIFHVNPQSIHAYVLGEHGDSQMIAWSAAMIGGQPIQELAEYKTMDKKLVSRAISGKAMDIIRLKGATFYGIGACAADIVHTILLNKRTVHPVSVYVEKYGVTLSMPAKIGWEGVQGVYQISLCEEEEDKLQASAEALREIQNLY